MRVVSLINFGADVDTVDEVCHSPPPPPLNYTPIPVHTYHKWSNIMCCGNITYSPDCLLTSEAAELCRF